MEKNDYRKRFVDIGLEYVTVAAARVVELHPRCSNKGIKNVDVYETPARIILFVTAGPLRSDGS